MPSLFISYRRNDSPDTVKLIYERLKTRLPRWEIFYDHESISLGEQFPDELRARVTSAVVVLVIIGPKWMEILKARRVATVDHVRTEVRLALEANTSVVPVLVGHAARPTHADLAEFEDLQPLLQRNGRPVRPDPDFDSDLESIIAHLRQFGIDEVIGATLADKYTLTAEIAHGGMGVVYRAEQRQPIKRTVAVKLIKPGMDSRDVLARFDAERQALAVMDHPNIAKVLDGGLTAGGRPFFVMEYVKGMSITQYCDEKKLTPQERLHLLIPVCNAVQHAHQKGIIHRDLKPSNVLVEVIDGKPVPKVIDFGLAKALGQKLTDKTLYTALDVRVGTLEYSAPEQAAGRTFDVDTRSDIYSLGVLLYELLTGSPPFTHEELLKIGEEEMRRVIREVLPAKPSKKLSSSGELPAIAANRHLETNKLTRLVQGDLDWIVMKCLEKERDRRYRTVSDVAEELQRFLSNEPVLAGPPSATYRLRKFAIRNKAGLLITASVAATVAATILVAFLRINAALESEKVANRLAESRQKEAEHALKSEQSAYRDLSAKQDELEGETARGWLLPLAKRPGSLSNTEADVLAIVAARRDGRLTTRFIEEAIRAPDFLPRLGARPQLIVHAAVGLDQAKRQAVEDALSARLREPNLPKKAQQDLASALAWTGDLTPASASLVHATVTRLVAECTDQAELIGLTEALAQLADRLTPEEAEQASGTVVDAFLRSTTGRSNVVQSLTRLSSRLNALGGRRLADRLIREIDRTDPLNFEQILALESGLEALSPVLDPQAANELWEQIGEAILASLPKCKNFHTMTSIARAFPPVLQRIGPDAGARITGRAARAIAHALMNTKDGDDPQWLDVGLTIVADYLVPTDAGDVAAEVVEIMKKHSSERAFQQMSRSLPKLLKRAETGRAERIAGEVASIMVLRIGVGPTPNAMEKLMLGLVQVAPWLGAKDAAKTAVTFVEQIVSPRVTINRVAMSAFSMLATRLDADGCRAVAAILTASLNKTDFGVPNQAANALVSVASRSSPADAENIADMLISTMERNGSNNDLMISSAEALTAALKRVDSRVAAKKIETAIARIGRPEALSRLEICLRYSSLRLDTADRNRLTELLANSLLNPLEKDQGLSYLTIERMASSLSSMINRCQFEVRAGLLKRATAAIASRIERESKLDAVIRLAKSLGHFLTEMDPQEAAHPAASATAALNRIIDTTTNSSELTETATALSLITAHMSTQDAARSLTWAVAKLNATLAVATVDFEINSLSESLGLISERMDLDDARTALATMIAALDKTADTPYMYPLAKSIALLAARLHPAAHAALLRSYGNSIVRVLETKKPDDTLATPELSETLVVIANKLDPDEAALLLGRAIAATANDPLATLSHGLVSLPNRLGVDDRLSYEIAFTLFRARATKPEADQSYLEASLSELLNTMKSAESAVAVVTAYGLAGGGNINLDVIIAMNSTFTRFAPSLPEQALADLLKNPLCVGPAQRAVLDALEKIYKQRFETKWSFVRFVKDQGLGIDLVGPPRQR